MNKLTVIFLFFFFRIKRTASPRCVVHTYYAIGPRKTIVGIFFDKKVIL